MAYLWMAGVLALTRAWHPGMQAILGVQALVATGLVYLIARRLEVRPVTSALLFGLAAALPVTEGDQQNVELIGLPFLLAGIWLGMSGGVGRAVAAGVLLAIAALCHPGLALQALGVGWFAALGGRPVRVLVLAAAALVTAAGFELAMAATGSLGAHRGILGSERALLIWSNGGAELAPITLLLRLAPLGAGLLGGLRIGWEQRTPAARLLGAWLPLAVMTAVLDPRGVMHQALPVVAPLALLAGRWVRPAAFVPSLAGLVVALQVMLWLPRLEMYLVGPWPYPRFQFTSFGWAQLPAYYGNWLGRASGATPWRAYAAGFPGRAAEVEDLAAAMRVEGRLTVWGDLPWLYVESGRLPAGRYVSHDPAWRLEPGAQRESLAAIRDRRPEYLVLAARPPAELNRTLRRDYDRLNFPPFRGLPWQVYGLHSG